MENKIKQLRAMLSCYGIDAYVVPSNDEFFNEYVPNHLRRLHWLTGFSGTNGVLIISNTQSLFFTDGRYLLQAERELGKLGVVILDIYKDDACSIGTQILRKGERLGYNPMLHTEANLQYYEKLAKKYGFILQPIEQDFVDSLWQEDRKYIPSAIETLPLKYTGMSIEQKLQKILGDFSTERIFMLLTKLDSICWLLNIRGHDVPFTPVFLAYLIIGKADIYLFTDATLSASIVISTHNVHYYKLHDIKSFYISLINNGHSIILDPLLVSSWFVTKVPEKQLIIKADPTLLPKACKNQIELDGIRYAHFLDAVSICKFIYWLISNVDNNIDELQAAEKLLEFRKKSELFVYPSFATISAFAENGAVVHYNPTTMTNKRIINRNGLYLLDSGGQYKCGTTDVSRVFCFGIPTAEQKRNYTLILKGHIGLAQARFPIGTTGAMLDSIARYHLWQYGLDYSHSTGHGVGHFLSVHEGPQSISKKANVALNCGMIISNEPGYYKNGEYGIRIESLMVVVESEYKDFLQFELLTLVPIAINLLDDSLLTQEELSWIRSYHRRIVMTLYPMLQQEELQCIISQYLF